LGVEITAHCDSLVKLCISKYSYLLAYLPTNLQHTIKNQVKLVSTVPRMVQDRQAGWHSSVCYCSEDSKFLSNIWLHTRLSTNT